MKRSDFLKYSLQFATAPLFLGAQNLVFTGRGAPVHRLTILHTNDTHSRIDPFPEGSGKFAGKGGAARRAALVKKIRQEQKNVLLLDAGDIFQGTPYFNLYKGALDYELMSEMKYDATTLGNHDFDNGVDGFMEVVNKANFPFVNVNYNFWKSPMKEIVKTFEVKDLNGIKVGIFGVGIDFANLVLPEHHEGIVYRDPLVVARYISKSLKHYHKCHLVICLSHLGYDYSDKNRVSDRILAADQNDIDLIIGGHTHTFLDQPVIIKKGDKRTIISQVGFGGIVLGRLDFTFNDSGEANYVGWFPTGVDSRIDTI